MSYVEAHMQNSLKDHVLETVIETEKIKGFYLKKPGRTRVMSTLIMFTPEGIVLQGDLTPGQNGNVSTYGYGLSWFSERKSEDYLCEKFLSKVFVPTLAVSCFREHVLMYRRDDSITKEKARDGWDGIKELEDNQEVEGRTFYELYWETFEDTPEIGYGYEPGEAGWLCAIQQKFAELYAKREVSELVAV